MKVLSTEQPPEFLKGITYFKDARTSIPYFRTPEMFEGTYIEYSLIIEDLFADDMQAFFENFGVYIKDENLKEIQEPEAYYLDEIISNNKIIQIHNNHNFKNKELSVIEAERKINIAIDAINKIKVEKVRDVE